MRSVQHHSVFGRPALLLGVLAVLLATTCPAGAVTLTCEQHAIRNQQVLLSGTLDNWEPVNDRTVLIWTGHSLRAHLVRLKSPLQGLMITPIIVLVDGDHDGRISPCGHDGVLLGEGAGGERHVADIISIELLSERRTVQLDPGEHVDRAGLMSV